MGWEPTTDADAIHDNVSAEISAISEKAVPVNADLVIIEDSAASNVKKKVQLGNLPGGGGGGAEDWVRNIIGYPVTVGADDVVWAGSDYSTDFTQVTVTGTQTVTERDGLLSVKFSGQTAGDWNCALKAHTFSVGDTFMVPLRLFGLTPTGGGSQSAGIIFTDGTSSGSNMVAGVNLTSSGDPEGLLVGYHGTLTAGTSAPWVANDSMAGWAWPQIFIRLEYDAANTFILAFSPDGITFEDFGEASISKTMTPTHLGVAWQMSATHAGDNIAIATFGPIDKIA